MGIKQEAGRRIKTARETKGLTLKDVEKLVPGITFNRLSNWEHGRNMIGVAEAKKLAPVLGVTAAYLLTLDDEPAEQRERVLLDHYRNSDARGRDHILGVAEQESQYNVEPPADSAKAA
jgi:transcriptional regulator with XRE-family HTH domain